MGTIDPQVLEEHFLELCSWIHTNHPITFMLSWLCGYDKIDMLKRNSEINDPVVDENVPYEPMS